MNENIPQAEEPKEFIIPEFKYAKFQAGIDKLNARAARLSVPPVTVIKVREDRIKLDRQVGDTEDRYIPATVVRIEGESPKLPGGWIFAATIEHTAVGNILRKAGSAAPEAPLSYRTCAPNCDHCRLARNRKDTYLVLSAAGDWKQIGRDCVADYLGHQNPEQLAFWASLLGLACDLAAGESDFDGEGMGTRDTLIGRDSFMKYAAGAIRLFGWWSREKAEIAMKPSTKDTTVSRMFPPRNVKREELWELTEEDSTLATDAVNWAITELGATPVEARREFDHNLVVTASMEALSWRDLGLAAYIVQAYRKHLGAIEEAKRAGVSNHVGEVGKRLRGLELTVTGIHSYESQYGVGEFIKFVDASGNRLTWKASGTQGLVVGKAYKVTGTIKSHGEFRGIKETYLSRCKVA